MSITVEEHDSMLSVLGADDFFEDVLGGMRKHDSSSDESSDNDHDSASSSDDHIFQYDDNNSENNNDNDYSEMYSPLFESQSANEANKLTHDEIDKNEFTTGGSNKEENNVESPFIEDIYSETSPFIKIGNAETSTEKVSLEKVRNAIKNMLKSL